MRRVLETTVCGVIAISLMAVMSAAGPAAQSKDKKDEKEKKLSPGTYARFNTSEGNFVIKLFDTQVPKTVENFVGLAEGTKEWTDPKSGDKVKRPFYDGLVFHRVIDGFMIQGGCPLGNGTGGPGYKFADEFNSKLRHNKAGILSMANAGPNTNGSQFFVTLGPTPHLDDRHSVFGEVVEGMDIVKKIGKVRTGANDRPAKPVTMDSVKIERVKG
jgi:peptidyl-prolyl cis-trans isomerase A (cyclophilin A)